MRHRRVLATVTAVALALMAPVAAFAQAPPPPAQDFSKVEIKTTKLSGNFYTLEGSGGMIGVLVGTDGVFMVDSQYAQLTEKIVAAIKQISDGRIRFMVNTHVHPDHTGGNENLGRMGVQILSRDQLRVRLSGGARPSPAAALALLTYDAPVTIHMNGEDVQLIPVRNAHTDGDTMVYFPKADVIMTGDFYRALGYPYPDRGNGGSFKGLIDGLNAVISLAGPNTKIVPGHGDVVNKTAVAAHRDVALAVRDKVAGLVKQGKSADEIVAMKPTTEFDARIVQPGTSAERFVRALVAEVSGQ